MKDVVFVTDNAAKVAALTNWLGYELPHQNIDLDELQELDSTLIVTHKAKEAFKHIGKPVLIEDVSLSFRALGRLPGGYIKWFIKELTLEGCCRLLDSFKDRFATAQVTYAYYAGDSIHIFEGVVHGSIAQNPKGEYGFGWDPIFIPHGSSLTYAEMDETVLPNYAVRPKAVAKLKTFLDILEA